MSLAGQHIILGVTGSIAAYKAVLLLRELTARGAVVTVVMSGNAEHFVAPLTFRTLSVRQMTTRLARAGFVVDHVLGDYRGRPWDERADVWIILARRS